MEDLLTHTKKTIKAFVSPENPEKAIPHQAIRRAVAIAFVAQHRSGLLGATITGCGVLLVRKKGTKTEWTGPIAIETGDIGASGGSTRTHAVMLFNDWRPVISFVESSKLKLGGEFPVLAGPVGRSSEADIRLGKNVPTAFGYSHSKGLFSGVTFDGVSLEIRDRDNERFYSDKKRVNAMDILTGQMDIPKSEKLHEIYDILYTFSFDGDWSDSCQNKQGNELENKQGNEIEIGTGNSKNKEDTSAEKSAEYGSQLTEREKERIKDQFRETEKTHEYFKPREEKERDRDQDKQDRGDRDRLDQDRDRGSRQNDQGGARDRDQNRGGQYRDSNQQTDQRGDNRDRGTNLHNQGGQYREQQRGGDNRDSGMEQQRGDYRDPQKDLQGAEGMGDKMLQKHQPADSRNKNKDVLE